jgi:cytochrome c biogenesis protein CcdA
MLAIFLAGLTVTGVVFFLACSHPAEASPFDIKPYLLDVTTNSAVVAFHLSAPSQASVRIYTNTTAPCFSDQEKKQDHFIQITGLKPSSTYSYQVVLDNGDMFPSSPSSSYHIRTACLPGESFNFVVYGDPRPGESGSYHYHQEIISQATMHAPSFALVLGDMVDDGDTLSQWRSFFEVEAPLVKQTPIYPVLGDNDIGTGRGLVEQYFPKLKKGYYQFQWGGIYFFGLNAWGTRAGQPQNEYDAQSKQYKWLVAQLIRPEVQKAQFRVVFVHDPVMISRGTSSRTYRKIWSSLFARHNVDLVFASWHLYERSHNQGVTYIVSGGGGAEILWPRANPAYPAQAEAREHHFCKVDVQSNSLTVKAIDSDGTVLDEMILNPKQLETENRQNSLVSRARRLQSHVTINHDPRAPVLPILLFSYDCRYCRNLLQFHLPDLAREKEVSLDISYFDLGRKGTYDLFLNAGAAFGRQGSDIPAIFIGNKVLGGQEEITSGLPHAMDRFLKAPHLYRQQSIDPFEQDHDTEHIQNKAFDSITLSMVMGAGLLDGLNPCAFATIIFLISYLALFGATSAQILTIGSLFTLAVFATYMGIGLFFHHSLSWLFTNHSLMTVVYTILLIAVVGLGFLNLKDFLDNLLNSHAQNTLRMPESIRTRIYAIIQNFASNKLTMFGAPLVLGSIIAGMELTCTGQVYIPIVTMISDPQHRATALVYLLIYNLFFILPLVIVFLLATSGVVFGHVAKGRYFLATIKFGQVLVYGLIAFIIMYNLGWLA